MSTSIKSIDERIAESTAHFQALLQQKEEKANEQERALTTGLEENFRVRMNQVLDSDVQEQLQARIVVNLATRTACGILSYRGGAIQIQLSYGNGTDYYTLEDVTDNALPWFTRPGPLSLYMDKVQEGLFVYLGEIVRLRDEAQAREDARQKQRAEEFENARVRREEERLETERHRARQREENKENERKGKEILDRAVLQLEPFTWPEKRALTIYHVRWYVGDSNFAEGYSLSDTLSRDGYITLEEEHDSDRCSALHPTRRIKLDPSVHLPIFTELTLECLDSLPWALQDMRTLKLADVDGDIEYPFYKAGTFTTFYVDTVPVRWVRDLLESA